MERSEKALEAQTCYSLANTYSLMRNYDLALQFYSRHLLTAKSLGDVVGEGRAYWSLAAACSASGLTDEAIKYAKEHLRVAEQVRSLCFVRVGAFAQWLEHVNLMRTRKAGARLVCQASILSGIGAGSA